MSKKEKECPRCGEIKYVKGELYRRYWKCARCDLFKFRWKVYRLEKEAFEKFGELSR